VCDTGIRRDRAKHESGDDVRIWTSRKVRSDFGIIVEKSIVEGNCFTMRWRFEEFGWVNWGRIWLQSSRDCERARNVFQPKPKDAPSSEVGR
jgi:hypothetical protein